MPLSKGPSNCSGFVNKKTQAKLTLHAILKGKQLCVDCEALCDRRSHPQGCRVVCHLCMRFGWGFPCVRRMDDNDNRGALRCDDCGFVFPNADCMEAHRRRVDPPPPGWEHDRRFGRPHRSMCEERRMCRQCDAVVWARAGAHQCRRPGAGQQQQPQPVVDAGIATVFDGQQQQQQQQQAQQLLLCHSCLGPHDPALTPCYIQPSQYARQWLWEDNQQAHPDDAEDEGDDDFAAVDGESEANDDDDGDDEPRQRRAKRVRFLFWDVECEQVAEQEGEGEVAEDDDDDEVQNLALMKRHRPLLVCAEVLCERCIAQGVRIEREPQRRAPGCFCGVPWRGPNRRRWAMPIGADAFEEDGGEAGVLDAMPAEQMPPDGLNPRRLHFFHDRATDRRTPIAQFVDFLLHTGPTNVCTVMLAHNGVTIIIITAH